MKDSHGGAGLCLPEVTTSSRENCNLANAPKKKWYYPKWYFSGGELRIYKVEDGYSGKYQA
jgi:hypothetical protein